MTATWCTPWKPRPVAPTGGGVAAGLVAPEDAAAAMLDAVARRRCGASARRGGGKARRKQTSGAATAEGAACKLRPRGAREGEARGGACGKLQARMPSGGRTLRGCAPPASRATRMRRQLSSSSRRPRPRLIAVSLPCSRTPSRCARLRRCRGSCGRSSRCRFHCATAQQRRRRRISARPPRCSRHVPSRRCLQLAAPES